MLCYEKIFEKSCSVEEQNEFWKSELKKTLLQIVMVQFLIGHSHVRCHQRNMSAADDYSKTERNKNKS